MIAKKILGTDILILKIRAVSILAFFVLFYVTGSTAQAQTINITSAPYNATTGSGDNAAAIQAAINAVGSGGTVLVPSGTFLSGPVTLKSNMTFQLAAGSILRMTAMGTFPASSNFLYGSSLTNITINGTGIMDGQGAAWWAAFNASSSTTRPAAMIYLTNCTGVTLTGITVKDSPMFHVQLLGNGSNIYVGGVTITAAWPSPNTDGIDLRGKNVLIENCYISDGDDMIQLGGSQAVAGVTIRNCAFGTGHGLSIGGYTQGGVSDLLVDNCTFTGSQYGIRWKTGRDRGGVINNLTYSNLTMTGILAYPFFLTSWYPNPSSLPPTSDTAAATTSTTPYWSNIVLRNITASVASGAKSPGIMWAVPEAPVSNVLLDAVTVTGPSGVNFEFHHARGVTIMCNVRVDGQAPPTDIGSFDATITYPPCGSNPTPTFTPMPPTNTPTRTNTPAPPTATVTFTSTKTNTPVSPTSTFTNTSTKTNTPIPPTFTFTQTFTNTSTSTKTNTPVPPSLTFTSTNTHTNTPVPPTATFTNTPIPPTNTFTFTNTLTRTNTPVPPTATFTNTPTFTSTPVPPTSTFTSTRTNTPIPPTSTFTNTATPSPTNTNSPVPPTSTFTKTATPSFTSTFTAVPPTNTFTNTPMPPTSTFTRTSTPSFTFTNSPVPPTSTFTPVPPTNTLTNTPIPPTLTFTVSPTRTNTPVPPTNTNTPVPPSSTPTLTRTFTAVPPTATNTPVPPTSTPTSSPTLVPPTATNTNSPVPLTSTNTPMPTSTNTPVPPTSTDTPVPPTSTATFTPTLVPPTATNTNTLTVTPSSTATRTPAPPTSTNTPVPPTITFTHTPVPPTSTFTRTVTPSFTSTFTAVPPTKTLTNTPVPPTTTFTAVPPTATFTHTLVPPTSTPTASNTPTPTSTNSMTRTDTLSATATASPTLTPTSGINVVLYPNPATGTAPIKIQVTGLTQSSSVTVELFTVSFRKIWKESLGQMGPGTINFTIPLTDQTGSPIANGVYYVVVRIDGKHFIEKLLIQR